MIIYNVSSYKRLDSLKMTIKSILPQCDIINVALNAYDEIPIELYDKKIRIIITNNAMGDAYKFLECEHSNGYFFTIDDDIIYPPNYTNFMIKNVEARGRQDIITLHGRVYPSFPTDSFCTEKCEVYHFNEYLSHSVNVHIGGTGVMCFHTSLMKIPFSEFKLPNMADLWVAKYAAERNIDITCVAHPYDYVKMQDTKSTSIFDKCKKGDFIQTAILNQIYSRKKIQ